MGVLLECVLLYDGCTVNESNQTRPRTTQNAPDAMLVQQARAGGLAGFEELVRRYRNDVFRLSFYYVRDREEAWDLSQEAFIKAFNGLGRFRGEAHFKTWLLRITANACKDHLKKRRLPTVAFDERVGPDAVRVNRGPDHALEAKELGRAIEAAVDTLSHKHKTAFLLREVEGLSYEEMARVMNCSLGTVMSRLHHARKRLQQHLIRSGVVEGGSYG